MSETNEISATSAKKVIVDHKKLGRIELGKLSKNDLCKSVVELLGVNMNLQRQVQIASRILNEVPEKTRKKAADKVAEELKKAQESAQKASN